MSLKNVNHQKRSFTWSMEKPSAKDYFLTVFIFAVCTLIGLLFQKLNFTDTNIVTIYILGVLLTSIVTDGYLCSVAGSFLSVFLFCFFLTEPRMSFKTYAVGYPVTFFIMLISSVLTGALAAKLKTHAKLSTQLAFRAQILFDTDRLLQKAKGETEILDVTCTQLLRLLNRNITAYVVENGTLSEGKLFSGEKEDTEDFLIPEEQQIAKWVCENRQHAGASTHHFPQAKCLYLAIRSGDNVYGVIGIPLQKETLDSFEYSILLSVINECALAMENAKNALEKEKNAVMAKNEQLRADLLRAISHDLRTPLCSISGNADMLLGNYALHNNEEKQVQFGAFTAEPGDGSIYVSFMGTDDSLIGWKEDFNMSFIRPIPSQLEAAEYVNETIKYSRRKIRLGGHSKGGNLAIYAAVKAKPALKRRIIAVYNNDGPGFDREMIESEEYRQMLPKIKTIVPEHSVVGMLLEHEEKYMIVKSSQTGIMQHDAMSWQVCGNRFETVKSVDRTSRMLNEALSNWINGLSRTQRSEFVETLFAIITSSGAVNLSDLSADRFNFAGSALKMYSSLDRETKIMLRRMLKSLTGEFDKARKMINNKFK